MGERIANHRCQVCRHPERWRAKLLRAGGASLDAARSAAQHGLASRTKSIRQQVIDLRVEKLAIPAGLEPATRGVEIRYSIQLSYGTVLRLGRAGLGYRLPVFYHAKYEKSARSPSLNRTVFLEAATKRNGGVSGCRVERQRTGRWIASPGTLVSFRDTAAGRLVGYGCAIRTACAVIS